MKRLMILLAGLLCYCNLIAQSDTTSIKIRKNEIGLSLQPLLIYAFTDPGSEPEYGISYKRKISKRFYLRSQLGYGRSISIGSEVYPESDTSLLIRSQHRIREYIFQRIGFEKRRSIKGIAFLTYGADLMAKQEWSESEDHLYSKKENAEITLEDALKAEIIERTTSSSVGTSWSIGLQIPVIKRLFVSSEFRATFLYSFLTQTTHDVSTGLKNTSRTRNLDTQFSKLLYNFTIGYTI